MKSVLERLNYVWTSLLASELVQSSAAVTDNQITEFAKILSRSTPVTPVEKSAHETIRYIFLIGKQDFVRMLATHGMSGLILACDGSSIAGELGVREKVEIRWLSGAAEYAVNRAGGRADEVQKWADMPPPKRTERPPRTDKYDSNARAAMKAKKNSERNYDRSERNGNERSERNYDRSERGRSSERSGGNERSDRNIDREKTKRQNKKSSIPPIGDSDATKILKMLKDVKKYSDVTAQEVPILPPTMGEQSSPVAATTPTAAPTTTPTPAATPTATPTNDVVITNDDILAISAALGGGIL